MKTTSALTHSGALLITLFGLMPDGYSQTPCKSVDARAIRMQSFQDASPQALAALRELTRNPPMSRIVNGQPTLVADNPWQIALIRSAVAEPTRSQFCGGSIIRNNWILTAAHCVQNSIVREDPTRVDVIAGSSQYAIGGERLKVAAVHKNPGYNAQTMDNDFALLRLQTPMTKGQVVATADANTQVADDTPVCVTGWGATFEGGPGAIDLLGAQIPAVSNAVCNQPESYNGDVLASMLCAGKVEGGLDSCQGDSGGPATASIQGVTKLVGVVSWGEGCARRLKYGIYSRVSTATQWLAQTIGGN